MSIHKIYVLFLFLLIPSIQSCSMNRSTRTSPNPQLAESGGETWVINGKIYNIESTYIIPFKNDSQFTINYLCSDVIDFKSLTKDEALGIAFPIMNYAYEHEIYKTKHVS
jgi:hypothetical protein